MRNIRILVNILAVLFGIAFADGLFEWGLSDDVYLFLGGGMVIAIIWLLVLVHKKELNEVS